MAIEARHDHALMSAIADRDEAALRDLYDRHSRLVYAMARRVLRDDGDAEDVVVDVFFELWASPQRFNPNRSSPRTYLMMVTRSRAIDRLRSRRSRPTAAMTEAVLSDTAGGDDPTEAASDRELGQLVRQTLDELPEDERRIIEWAYFEGLTQTQIAERSGAPLGTIKTWVRRGLGKLREALVESKGESAR